MFKKTLIMSVAAAGLICGTAFAADMNSNAQNFGVTFASSLDMLGTSYADTNQDLSLINNVQVGLSYFNWGQHSFALNAGMGYQIPDNSNGHEDNTYQIRLGALYLSDISNDNYLTAGLGFAYQSAPAPASEQIGGDDTNTALSFALVGGFMHRINSWNSVFSVSVPVVQSITTDSSNSDSTTEIDLFSGADVAWTYFFK